MAASDAPQFVYAIAREPSATFANGLTTATLGPPDLQTALVQHRAYCEALERCGLNVTVLTPLPDYPDSTFVEDTAVVFDGHAVLARPGASSRAGEVAEIETAISERFSALHRIDAPGTLDGGDVCEAGTHFYIGISHRTNPLGAMQLAAIVQHAGYSSSLVDIRNLSSILHLKSGMTYLGDGTFVVIDDLAARVDLRGGAAIAVDPDEAYGANCIRVNDRVIVAAGNPKLELRLREAGFLPLVLDVSEYRKMDGGLSCLSLRF